MYDKGRKEYLLSSLNDINVEMHKVLFPIRPPIRLEKDFMDVKQETNENLEIYDCEDGLKAFVIVQEVLDNNVAEALINY